VVVLVVLDILQTQQMDLVILVDLVDLLVIQQRKVQVMPVEQNQEQIQRLKDILVETELLMVMVVVEQVVKEQIEITKLAVLVV
jgi:hypothetical protein|tara:strand:- start:1244 stop:1495 length:252 start_codon:yes stop_codon:yes gene_type:complete